MSGALTITHQDDTPLGGITLTAERAVPSVHVDLKITNIGDEDVVGAFVAMYAEVTPGSGLFFTSGHAILDERQGRFEITGQDSGATAGQEIILGVVQPLGHLAIARLPTIKPGDWILADFWIEQPGSSAAGGAVNIKLEIANERSAYPLPWGIGWGGGGINRGKKQAKSFLIEGRHATATGTPDDEVHVAAGDWLILGEEYRDTNIVDVTINQDDHDGDTLAAGESYIAVLTQGPGDGQVPTVTKGIKAVTPERPTPPLNELILCWVTVSYQVGGTSILSPGDIEEDLTFGRLRVGAPPTGLTVVIEEGESVIGDFAQVRPIKGFVDLFPSTTNYIWWEWSGQANVTTTNVPPTYGAILLAEVDTDGSNVTEVRDRRRYYHAGELLHEAPVGVIDGVNQDFTITEDADGMLVADGSILLEPDQFVRTGRQIHYGGGFGGGWHRWYYVG